MHRQFNWLLWAAACTAAAAEPRGGTLSAPGDPEEPKARFERECRELGFDLDRVSEANVGELTGRFRDLKNLERELRLLPAGAGRGCSIRELEFKVRDAQKLLALEALWRRVKTACLGPASAGAGEDPAQVEPSLRAFLPSEPEAPSAALRSLEAAVRSFRYFGDHPRVAASRAFFALDDPPGGDPGAAWAAVLEGQCACRSVPYWEWEFSRRAEGSPRAEAAEISELKQQLENSRKTCAAWRGREKERRARTPAEALRQVELAVAAVESESGAGARPFPEGAPGEPGEPARLSLWGGGVSPACDLLLLYELPLLENPEDDSLAEAVELRSRHDLCDLRRLKRPLRALVFYRSRWADRPAGLSRKGLEAAQLPGPILWVDLDRYEKAWKPGGLHSFIEAELRAPRAR